MRTALRKYRGKWMAVELSASGRCLYVLNENLGPTKQLAWTYGRMFGYW